MTNLGVRSCDIGVCLLFVQVVAGFNAAHADESAAAAQRGLAEYAEAIDALSAADFPSAVRALSRAIKADEENARFYRARGVAGILSEKFDDAKRDFDRANRLEPGDKVTRIWLDGWTSMAQPGLGGGLNEVLPGAEVAPYQKLLTQTVFEYKRFFEEADQIAEKYQAKLNELHAKVEALVEQMEGVQIEMSQTSDRAKQGELRNKLIALQSEMQTLLQEITETQRKMYEEQMRHNQSAP